MTRHELKEQLQHDPFRDNVAEAVTYVALHRRQAVRWVAIAAVVLVIAAAVYAVLRYQRSQREQALAAAMSVLEAPVVAQPDGFGKTFTTQQAKDDASMKALSDIAAKYSGTEQGDAARYYLAGLQATNNKLADAERNFKAVASSGSQFSALAKVGLGELYLGQGRLQQARDLFESLVANPSPLVSKEQATLLLANAVKSQDPKRANQLAKSLKTANQRPAIERAADQIIQDTK